MKALITGDSHVIALLEANAANRPDGDDLEIDVRQLGPGLSLSARFLEDRGLFAEMTDEECVKRFRRLPPEDKRYDIIGVSAPVHSTRIWRQPEWKDFTPWGAQLEGEATISQDTLNKIIDDEIGPSLELIDILLRTTPVFVIEAPWPFRHHPALARNGQHKVQFLHRAVRSRALAALEARNVPVVEFDPKWADADGFTLAEFRHWKRKDNHHGNAEFGRKVMAKIYDFLRLSQAGAA